MPDMSFVKERGGRRLRWSLPVLVDWNKTVYTASTEDLSASGARLKTPVCFAPGSVVNVTNLQSGRKTRFRVVWGNPERGSDDCYRLGVQMLTQSDGFWGFDFETGRRPLGGLRSGESLASQTLSWRNN